MLSVIGNLIKVALFFLGLWSERDKEKARKKANVAAEVVEAFKEVDNEKRASKLNAAVGSINRLR